MGTIRIEFYRDQHQDVETNAEIEGRLMSSVENASTSTTPAHATIPKGATYARIYGIERHYYEVGIGNQTVATGRRTEVLANLPIRQSLSTTDNTISYRSVV